MRLAIALAGTLLLSASALAQTGTSAAPQTAQHPGTGMDREPSRTESEARSPGPPLDRGPQTPEADRAHRGGGVVLEGAPGAPAPPPMPTPPRDPR